MLAAAQEIDKLHLLYGTNQIDDQAVLEAVSDSARYDVYGLVDAALSGDIKRVDRMLAGLRAEGVEPVLMVWALAREIRTLLPMASIVVIAGLKRHNLQSWQDLLQHAAKIDRIIKGLMAGNVWDELLQLALGVAGVYLFRQPEMV